MYIIKKRKRIIIRIQQSTRIGKIHVASKYIFPSIVFHVFNAIIYYFFFLFNIKHVIRSFDLHKINVRRTIISNNPMYTHEHTHTYIYIRSKRQASIFVDGENVDDFSFNFNNWHRLMKMTRWK